MVGLYVAPLERALVLRVDEREPDSGARPNPVRGGMMSSGRALKRTLDVPE